MSAQSLSPTTAPPPVPPVEQDHTPERTEKRVPHKRLRCVRDVAPRALSEMANGRELVRGILCALLAHEKVYELADGELHGDINPNTILLFDHSADACPWDQPARTAGAIIYWEPPITIQTLRKMGEVPDRPHPPPPARRAFVLPPYAYGYGWYWQH